MQLQNADGSTPFGEFMLALKTCDKKTLLSRSTIALIAKSHPINSSLRGGGRLLPPALLLAAESVGQSRASKGGAYPAAAAPVLFPGLYPIQREQELLIALGVAN